MHAPSAGRHPRHGRAHPPRARARRRVRPAPGGRRGGRDLRGDRALGTETRALELTDRHLEVLASVFEEKHLSNALELVQSGKVKRLVAKTRRVVRASRFAAGPRRREYLCYPDASCSCAFQWGVNPRAASGWRASTSRREWRPPPTRASSRRSRTCSRRSCGGRTRAGRGGEKKIRRETALRAVTKKRAFTRTPATAERVSMPRVRGSPVAERRRACTSVTKNKNRGV